jgi:capsular polysaccharide transport system permease protein
LASFQQGWRIQTRVIGALMVRELSTRFGRENIGFLWIMVEPLLFAVLVGMIWRLMKGPVEHGVTIMSFVVSGYIPLVMFRSSISRCVGLFAANGSLLYHRQIKIADFVFVRFLVEVIGHMMAYIFVGAFLIAIGQFPVPFNIGFLILGWAYYSFFCLSVCFILAPLSATSEVVEKFMPVTVYVMIPFSGTFTMMSWLAPMAQKIVSWSPPANAMEMMRYGLYGHDILPIFDYTYPLKVSMVLMLVGLMACRLIRRTLVVE